MYSISALTSFVKRRLNTTNIIARLNKAAQMMAVEEIVIPEKLTKITKITTKNTFPGRNWVVFDFYYIEESMRIWEILSEIG